MHKCPFFGKIISKHGVGPDPHKLHELTEMSPQSKKELQLFHGILKYLSKFLTASREVCKPFAEHWAGSNIIIPPPKQWSSIVEACKKFKKAHNLKMYETNFGIMLVMLHIITIQVGMELLSCNNTVQHANRRSDAKDRQKRINSSPTSECITGVPN